MVPVMDVEQLKTYHDKLKAEERELLTFMQTEEYKTLSELDKILIGNQWTFTMLLAGTVSRRINLSA